MTRNQPPIWVIKLLPAMACAAITACSSSVDRDPSDAAGLSTSEPSHTRDSLATTDEVAPPSALRRPTITDVSPRNFAGLTNVVAFHDEFYSGSAPDGAAGFDSLARLGVTTIISVDGAVPDVAAAAAHGMRYIHLPIGYDGFEESRKLELTRAARDAIEVGAVYVHCHHGKHRSAGAAGTIAASLGWAAPGAMAERMRVSGTSPSYPGLYACAANATVIADAIIDRVPGDFPSVSRPEGMVKSMVEISELHERLKLIERAGWRTPPNHPDLVPAAEAGRMADLLRLLQEDDRVQQAPADFADLLRASRDHAQRLESMILDTDSDAKRLSGQFQLVAASCKGCHVKYRD